MEYCISSKMVGSGAICPEIYLLILRYTGTTNSGELKESSRKFGISYMVEYVNKSKKSQMDHINHY